MASKFISIRNLKFLINEVLDVASLTKAPYYSMHTPKSFDLVLDAAMKLSKQLLHPVFEEMDRKQPYLENGAVKVHPSVKEMMKEFGQGGWIGATFPEEIDGEQLPDVVNRACQLIISAANYSSGVFPSLTSGAAGLLWAFAAKELQDTYLPKMLAGEWQGTMALTEPNAGSSLADITTTATPTDEGYYLLKGTKVFISAGDHDGVENVVHLILARIEGAPIGVKGISLFVAPKKRVEADGTLVSNDVSVSQVFHKMGYRGAPITELSFGDKNDCRCHLVGEANQGLMCMFKMMNEARIGVGAGATAIASAAYYAALDYAKTRPQGRKVTAKDPSTPQIPIVEHADIRRMLLFQRAVVEGSEALLLQCAKYEDMVNTTPKEEHERLHLLLDLLTPIAKTYPSEMGILSTSQAIQCLGGYGYCDDFPVEQHFRDSRIHPIHEGTTGIQGIDLLGRKVIMKEGKAFKLFLEEVQKTLEAAKEVKEVSSLVEVLDGAVKQLTQVTVDLAKVMGEKGIEVYLSDATLYLEAFSIIAVAWQWLTQATVAQKALNGKVKSKDINFYKGKVHTAKYFFAYELPKIAGLFQRLTDGDPLTVEMESTYFND